MSSDDDEIEGSSDSSDAEWEMVNEKNRLRVAVTVKKPDLQMQKSSEMQGLRYIIIKDEDENEEGELVEGDAFVDDANPPKIVHVDEEELFESEAETSETDDEMIETMNKRQLQVALGKRGIPMPRAGRPTATQMRDLLREWRERRDRKRTAIEREHAQLEKEHREEQETQEGEEDLEPASKRRRMRGAEEVDGEDEGSALINGDAEQAEEENTAYPFDLKFLELRAAVKRRKLLASGPKKVLLMRLVADMLETGELTDDQVKERTRLAAETEQQKRQARFSKRLSVLERAKRSEERRAATEARRRVGGRRGGTTRQATDEVGRAQSTATTTTTSVISSLTSSVTTATEAEVDPTGGVTGRRSTQSAATTRVMQQRTDSMRQRVQEVASEISRERRDKEEKRQRRQEETAKRKREREAIMNRKDELQALKKRKVEDKRMQIFLEQLRWKENLLYMTRPELLKLCADTGKLHSFVSKQELIDRIVGLTGDRKSVRHYTEDEIVQILLAEEGKLTAKAVATRFRLFDYVRPKRIVSRVKAIKKEHAEGEESKEAPRQEDKPSAHTRRKRATPAPAEEEAEVVLQPVTMTELLDYRSLLDSYVTELPKNQERLETLLFQADEAVKIHMDLEWPDDGVQWNLDDHRAKCVDDDDYADPEELPSPPSSRRAYAQSFASPAFTALNAPPTSDFPLRVFLEQLHREWQQRKGRKEVSALPCGMREAMVEKTRGFLLHFLALMEDEQMRRRNRTAKDERGRQELRSMIARKRALDKEELLRLEEAKRRERRRRREPLSVGGAIQIMGQPEPDRDESVDRRDREVDGADQEEKRAMKGKERVDINDDGDDDNDDDQRTSGTTTTTTKTHSGTGSTESQNESGLSPQQHEMSEKERQAALKRWMSSQLLYEPLEACNWKTVSNLALKFADELDLPDVVYLRAKKRLQDLFGDTTQHATGLREGEALGALSAPHRFVLPRITELQADYLEYRDHPLPFFPPVD